MLTEPLYSHVVERLVDGEIAKLKCVMGYLSHSVVLAKEASKHEHNPTLKKRI